jgi:hypothetical protein
MVTLLRVHDRAGTESTRALASILALPLPPMGWIHAVGKFVVVHQFVYDTAHSTGIYGSSFLHLIFICVSAIVGARILIFFGFNPKTIPELGKL